MYLKNQQSKSVVLFRCGNNNAIGVITISEITLTEQSKRNVSVDNNVEFCLSSLRIITSTISLQVDIPAYHYRQEVSNEMSPMVKKVRLLWDFLAVLCFFWPFYKRETQCEIEIRPCRVGPVPIFLTQSAFHEWISGGFQNVIQGVSFDNTGEEWRETEEVQWLRWIQYDLRIRLWDGLDLRLIEGLSSHRSEGKRNEREIRLNTPERAECVCVCAHL